MRRSILLLMLSGPFFVSGCSDSDSGLATPRRNEGWTTIRLPDTTKAEAFEAALYAMKQWFRLEQVSPVDGQLRSVTMEYDQRGGGERIRDTALKFRNRMRRTAYLHVQEQGADCLARCIVRVQRLDTADHRIFRGNDTFTDYPTETPIDREAGVSAGQDQVWTDMPRDRQLESDILGVLRSRLQGATTRAVPTS
jgi:hypothetical protein